MLGRIGRPDPESTLITTWAVASVLSPPYGGGRRLSVDGSAIFDNLARVANNFNYNVGLTNKTLTTWQFLNRISKLKAFF